MIKNILIFALLTICNCASAADILWTWDKPTLREDGTSITGEITYRIYHNFGDETVVINLPDVSEHLLEDVQPGVHSSTISTIEDGVEGRKSEPCLSVVLSPPSVVILKCEVVQ